MVAAGCSGGDWEDVEIRWTLPRYYAMCQHWKRMGPPVYISVAGYMGLIGKDKSKSKSGDMDELARMFASSGGIISG